MAKNALSKFSVANLRERLYDKSVDLTLRFYERWVLPQSWWNNYGPEQRVSLKELKLREFRDRKALLNPYKRDQLISSAVNSVEMQKLAEKTSVATMYNFSISYDRHKDRYVYRTHDFPSEYQVNESSLNYANDPDWVKKLAIKRVNFKKLILGLVVLYWWIQRRVAMVEEFDRLKRLE